MGYSFVGACNDCGSYFFFGFGCWRGLQVRQNPFFRALLENVEPLVTALAVEVIDLRHVGFLSNRYGVSVSRV
ncbi:hypothetical protein, partial [Pseudomonas aeruginosa]|uniref:hypothetical protein n=1 Tax=Pseudomonas aeruginosa TaxID=287 RepID=UPI001C4E8FDE